MSKSEIINSSEDDVEGDVMKEIEDFVKPRRNKNKDKSNYEDDDVYDMCDQMLEDLSYLDE